MKKFLDWIKIWAGIMTFMLLFIIIWYYIVKARTWTTATPWDKLTASKWNELVANLSGDSSKISALENKLTLPAWIVPTLQNWWVNRSVANWVWHNDAGYMKDWLGFVHIRGLLSNWTITACIFTLPAWYRPMNRYVYTAYSTTGAARVDVRADWCVWPMNWSNGRFPLDWITFKAEQ